MAYLNYESGKPDGTVQTVLEVTASTRRNVQALIDGLVMGGVYEGVNMTVTGDPDQPDEVLYEHDPARIRMEILWNIDGNPEYISYYSSGDSGASWDHIGDKTVSWDVDGNVTDVLWGDVTKSIVNTCFSKATLIPQAAMVVPIGLDLLWTPEEINDVDLYTWLDASDGNFTIEADKITQWTDKGINVNSPTALDNNPAVLSAELNGLDVVSFNDDSLEFTDKTVATLVPAVDIYVVTRAHTLGGNRAIFRCTTSSTSNALVQFGPLDADTFRLFMRLSSGSSTLDDALDTNWTIWNGLCGYSDGVAFIRRDGLQTRSASFTGELSTSSESAYNNLGAFAHLSWNRANSDIAEFLIFQKKLSDDDRYRMEGYLAHKWGLESNLDISHPYKNSPPWKDI